MIIENILVSTLQFDVTLTTSPFVKIDCIPNVENDDLYWLIFNTVGALAPDVFRMAKDVD